MVAQATAMQPRYRQTSPPPSNAASAPPPLNFRKASIRKRSLLAQAAVNNGAGSDFGQQYNREIDSKGYMGRLQLLYSGSWVISTGSAGPASDWPYNLASLIEVRDSSGGMLFRAKGYNAHLAQRFFGCAHRTAPIGSTDTEILSTDTTAASTVQARFSYDIGIETNARDNLGLVPNQNAAFKYTVTVTHDVKANLFTTPANIGTIALGLQPEYEYYTVPAPVRADGRAQEVAPPFAGVVRQQWDETQVMIPSIENRVQLTPGKVIRNLILVPRNAGGVRQPSGITRLKFLYGDDTLLFETTGQELRERAFKAFGLDSPAGVYPVLFDDDAAGFPGADYRRDLVDTRALSQVYMLATLGAGVTQLDIVHDELIVPAGVSL